MSFVKVEEIREALMNLPPKYRCGALCDLYMFMDEVDFYKLLGKFWSASRGFYPRDAYLASLLFNAKREHLDQMMTEEELHVQRSIKPGTKIYRGCYSYNLKGMSWTLDRTVAETLIFQDGFRDAVRKPRIAIAEVLDPSVLVYKNDNKELEVIVTSFEGVRVEKLAYAKKRELSFSSELVH